MYSSVMEYLFACHVQGPGLVPRTQKKEILWSEYSAMGNLWTGTQS